MCLNLALWDRTRLIDAAVLWISWDFNFVFGKTVVASNCVIRTTFLLSSVPDFSRSSCDVGREVVIELHLVD